MWCYNHIFRFLFKCKIIYFQKLCLYIFNIKSEWFISLFCGIPYNRTPCAIIKLKITASSLIKLCDNFLICCSYILYKLIIRLIKLSCLSNILRNYHLLVHLCRCRNRIFSHCILILKLLKKFKIFHKWMFFCLNPANKISGFKVCHLSIKLNSAALFLMSNTFKSPHKIKMPELSAKFSICYSMKACCFLLCDNVTDAVICYFFKLVLCNLTCRKISLSIF